MHRWRHAITAVQRVAHSPAPTPYHLYNLPRIGIIGSGGGDASQKVQLLQRVQSPRYASSGRMKRVVQTLDPGQLSFLDQDSLDLSGIITPEVYITTPEDGFVRISLSYSYAENRKKVPFPPNTTGTLYFHHLPGDSANSQIRFRLCYNAVNFHSGRDLLLPDGQPWRITVPDMARSPNSYGLFAVALAEEFPDLPSLVQRQSRVVRTFSPQTLMRASGAASAQPVFNLSGLTSPRVRFAHSDLAEQETGLRNMQFTYFRQDGELLPFPDDTVGVFYYKQSSISPKRIGELRFRLCPDTSSFREGTDLCLPTGDPWYMDSDGIVFSSEKQQGLFIALAQEDLLIRGPDFYEVPTDLHARFSKAPHLGSLSEPFVLDLAQNSIYLWLRVGSTWEHMRLPGIFPSRISIKDAPFSGRVIARLEQYPRTLVTGSPSKSPLVALKFIEALTPIRQIKPTNYILKPTAGMLHLTRQRGGGFLPWGYSPTSPEIREKLLAFVRQPVKKR